MTVKKLVKSTHPILNKTIQPVSTYDQKLKVLLEDLEDTLYHEEAAAISFALSKMLTSVVMRLKSSTQLLLEKFCCVLIQLF